jgi:hypothetical protein
MRTVEGHLQAERLWRALNGLSQAPLARRQQAGTGVARIRYPSCTPRPAPCPSCRAAPQVTIHIYVMPIWLYLQTPGRSLDARQHAHVQVHYLKVRPPDDHSGVTLLLKPHAVPYAAGLVSFASWFTIPPGKKSHPIVNTCCYKCVRYMGRQDRL